MIQNAINILQEITVLVTCGDTQGSAFFISPQILLTCFHVIKDNIKSQEAILLRTNTGQEIEAELHPCIKVNESILYETKDVAVLLVKGSYKCTTTPFISFQDISVGDTWMSRGFLRFKPQGENLIGDNRIQQIHKSLKNNACNIELNLVTKYQSYEGFSGAPLVVNENIVGILNSELLIEGSVCELYALSLGEIKDLWSKLNLEFNELPPNNNKINTDKAGADLFTALQKDDIRSLKEKILDVCDNYNPNKIKKYQRDAINGLHETNLYDSKQIASMKFRIFEACQDYLIDFLEGKKDFQLTSNEIDQVIESFTIKAMDVLEDRSKDYSYPLKSKDILKKMVLDLIESCYLSFDERGIYNG